VSLRRPITPFLILLTLVGSASTLAAQCEPDGNVQFVCGPVSPEDLIQVPNSPWVIVSSWEADGYLSAVDSRDYGVHRLFPLPSAEARPDTSTYGACPGMTMEGFHPHGVSLRPGANGLHTLYVVRHGERESVEVFEIDARGTSPTLTWIGCVVAPQGLGLNAVAAIPGGGFAVTSPRTGDLWEWHAGAEWTQVPGSQGIGPNGLEVSLDGAWYYVGGYGAQALIRLSRGSANIEMEAVQVGFHVDNVRWAPDGSLFVAGHESPTPGRVGECISRRFCDGIVTRVTRVSAELDDTSDIFTYHSNDLLPLGTVAIQVGDELWVGTVAGGERIARVRIP